MRPKKNAVSLVVTIRDDEVALRELLANVERQSRPPDEAVIVVAQSSDQSLVAARQWRPKGIVVKVIFAPRSNRSAGRNRGVAQATGGIIVFTDAGCRPEAGWLENLVAPLADSRIDLVSGFTAGEWRTDFEEAQVPFVLVPVEKIPPHPLPATRNMAIRRSVFTQFGGFREDLNYAEDFEFSRRLAQKGIQAVFVPEAVVYWRPRRTLLSFSGMIARLTAGDVQAGIIRPGLETMWIRYLGLVILWLIFGPIAIAAYVVYLLAKVSRFRFSRPQVYWVATRVQAMADVAVLVGSLAGLASRLFSSDNTPNVA